MSISDAEIRMSPAATALERFAGDELKRYLAALFGIEAAVTDRPAGQADHRFVVGLSTDPAIRECAGALPPLSDQGHIVRRVSADTMLLAGASSAAVAWAVYELVEHYGVRYLLHEDVFPLKPGRFHLPDVDAVFEPVQQRRSWRLMCDLPIGPAMWSLDQHRRFIAQIFKLKFNGIYLSLWPHQPFIDYEVGGISRDSAHFLFGEKIPVDADTIGREHLPDAPHLTHPQFLGINSFPDMLAVGQRFVHALMDAARQMGMRTEISIQPLEFPHVFRPLLQKPSGTTQLGDLVGSETGDLTNADHVELVRAKIAAYLEAYPEVDELSLGLPEFPHAGEVFRERWTELAAKYRLEPDFNIDRMAAFAESDHLTPGCATRSATDFKSAVAMLHFFDWFFAGNDLLGRAAAAGVTLGLDLGIAGVGVLPFLDRVIWPGGTVSTALDYTSSRAVRRLDVMETLDASKVSASLVITLQDDNVGWLPQVATENIHVLLQAMHRLGWRGYSTRFWPIGDLDPAAAYMARASWDIALTPRRAYADHVERNYGAAAVEPFSQVMRMLEDVTVVLDLDFLGLFFPVLTHMSARARSTEVMAEGLFHVRAAYEQARRILSRLRQQPGPAARREDLEYWLGRLDMSIHALREVELLSAGGVSIQSARTEPGAADGHIAHASACYRDAIESGEAAIRSAAAIIRDDSDRYSTAAYYHFWVREVREETQAILRSVQAAGDDKL